MSLRTKISAAARGLGIIEGLLATRKRLASPWLVSFCYHRIAEPGAAAGVDDALSDATPAGFDAQVAFLAKHFRFVSVGELVAFTEGRGSLPPNPALLTFDDGYRECLTTALPILKRHGARASFYIPTRYMEERRVFWWDRNALTLKRSTKERITLTYPREVSVDPREPGAVEVLNQVIKKERGLSLDRYFEDLERAAGVEFGRVEETELANQMLMTWEEVAKLAAEGMDIGSHTHSHRVLQTVLPENYDVELAGSRRIIEQRIGKPVEVLAYPVGYGLQQDPALCDAVRAGGYKVGLTCRSGPMRTFSKPDMLDVPRILMDSSYDFGQFTAFSALPHLAPRTSVDV